MNTDALKTETLQIPTDDGVAEAYLTRPDAERRPGVLMFMDAIGVRDRTRAMADRIASRGFVVLLPNVFYREGSITDLAPILDLRDPENRKEFGKVSMPRVGAYTPDLSEPDMQAWFAALDEYAAPPFGVVGYCMGATLAIRAAAQRPQDVAAVGCFHGAKMVRDDAGSPHRLIPTTKAEYVFGHADQDELNPAESIEELGRTVAEAGLTASNEVYPEAPHGFTMSDTASYQEAGEQRHWRELEALFDRRLAS